MDEQLSGLQTQTAAKRSKLDESIKLHQYLQDVEEVVSWLGDKEKVAASDDYGKDFEHLLVCVCVCICMCVCVCVHMHVCVHECGVMVDSWIDAISESG